MPDMIELSIGQNHFVWCACVVANSFRSAMKWGQWDAPFGPERRFHVSVGAGVSSLVLSRTYISPLDDQTDSTHTDGANCGRQNRVGFAMGGTRRCGDRVVRFPA